jgi:DNA-binding NarL/FixJ family response regulator
MKIKVGIVEDNPNLIKSVIEKLSLFEQVEIEFVAVNGREAIDRMYNHKPDVILMDINMPEMDGVTATRKIKEHWPAVKIIMLTVFDDNEKIFNSILAGASGYLLKDEKPGKIIEALEEATEGGAPMSPTIAAKSLQLIRQVSAKPESDVDFDLTRREMEILEHISKGENYQEIADRLFISPKTVRKHIENIYRKLHVHNKVEAVQLAIKHGLV